MKFFSSLLFFLLFMASSFAVNTDSLRTLLKTQKGEARIETMCELVSALPSKQADEALELARKAVDEAVALSNDKLIVKANSSLGSAYEKKHLLPEAIVTLKEALRVAERIGDKKRMGVICTNIGRNIFSYRGDMKEAMNYYLQAIGIYQQIGEYERMARTYVNIANLMSAQGDQEGALDYYKKAMPVIKDSMALAGIYNNIGAVYYQKKDYRRSLEWLEKALGVKTRNGEDEAEIAASYNNIGGVLVNLGEYEKAKTYLEKSLEMNTAAGDSAGVAMNKNNIGSLYLDMGNLVLGEQYLLEGVELAQRNDMKNLAKEGFELLAKLYEQKNDFRKAYAYQERYMEIDEGMRSSDVQQQITAAQEKIAAQLREQEARESEMRKQKENELLQVKSERQNLFIGMLAIGVLALLITASLFILRYSEKKKANRLLENRNLTIEAQKFEIEVKNREITDSINYAQRLQQAVLPDEKNLRDIFPESFVLFLPRDIVSGDFFWCATAAQKTVIAVADCTGHGVPGALLSMIGNNLLHQVVYEKKITDPGRILTELNKGLASLLLHQENGIKKEEGPEEIVVRDGMDIGICVIDSVSRVAAFAGANRPMIIIRKEEITELLPDRVSIGGITPSGFVFAQKETVLQPGDALYMFTDGYADQFGGEKGKKLMTKNLKQQLLAGSAQNMQKQKDLLAAYFSQWKSGYGQVDDVLLAGIRIR